MLHNWVPTFQMWPLTVTCWWNLLGNAKLFYMGRNTWCYARGKNFYYSEKWLCQLQPKMTESVLRQPEADKVKHCTVDQLRNRRTSKTMLCANLIDETWLEGQHFDDVFLVTAWQSIKGLRYWYVLRHGQHDTGPLAPPNLILYKHGQKWWTSKNKFCFWLDKLIKNPNYD